MPDKGDRVTLRREISFPILFFLIISSILGTGVFFTPSITAGIAGHWMVFSWALIGIISILIASMFGELVERFPFAGGTYEYAKEAFGTFPSFLVGWMAILGSNITISMLTVGAIKYINPSLPSLPSIIFGLILIWAFSILSSRGLKTSAIALFIFSTIPVLLIIISSFLGFSHASLSNIIPSQPFQFLPFLLASFIAADTFFGWESSTYLSEEVKNPRKVIPKALRLATVATVIFVLILIVSLLASLGISQLSNTETPIFTLVKNSLGTKYGKIVSLLIYLAIIGSVADWVVSSPRLLLAMARDKLMISQLAEIDPKTRTPKKAIIFQAILSSLILIIGIGTYRVILETLLPLTFSLYSLLAIALLKVRKNSDYKPNYPIYFGNFGIFLILFINLSLLVVWFVTSPFSSFITTNLIGLLLLAFPIFLLLNTFYNPDFLRLSPRSLSKITKSFEYLLLPKHIKNFVFTLFQNLEKKSVLDFGSGVGTLTLPLAEMVTPRGVVYAIDMNKENLKILEKRLKKKGIKHVKIIHDPFFHSRIHPSVGKVDAVFSLGTLGYIRELSPILRDLYERLPEGGRICFVDYIDFFKILPNPDLLKDLKKLQEILKKGGFSVRIKKIKGLLWNYLIVYGIKTSEECEFI